MSPDASFLRDTLPSLPQPFRAVARASVLDERLRDLAFGPGLPADLATDIDARLRAIDALLDAEAARGDLAPGDPVVIQTAAGQRIGRVASVTAGGLTLVGDPTVWPRLAVLHNRRLRPDAAPEGAA